MALEMGGTTFMQREKEPKPGLSANLPHRDIATAQQLNSLLGIIQQLYPAVLAPWQSEEDDFKGRPTPTRTEARIAAENVFQVACARLEAILADDYRWGTEFQKSLEKKYDEAFQKNKEFLDAQTDAAQELTRPHFRFRPSIVRIGINQFCAFIGDPTKPEAFICGLGETPAEAIESFDEYFESGVNPNILNWMRLREAALDAGIEPPAEPPTNTNEEQQNRDTQGTKGDGSDTQGSS